MYFRLCARLRQTDRALQFYDMSRSKRVKFSPSVYKYALHSVSHDPEHYKRLQHKVLADMSSERFVPDSSIIHEMLRGAASCGDIEQALECFKALELRYVLMLGMTDV